MADKDKMQECWINVYQLKNQVWYGNCHSERWKFDIAKTHIIYRIHVIMKPYVKEYGVYKRA